MYKNSENFMLAIAVVLLALIGFVANGKFKRQALPRPPITHNPNLEDKVSLLGIVANQNNAVIANHRPSEELIFINPDWTIDQMPSQVEVEPATSNFLKKHMRKKK